MVGGRSEHLRIYRGARLVLLGVRAVRESVWFGLFRQVHTSPGMSRLDIRTPPPGRRSTWSSTFNWFNSSFIRRLTPAAHRKNHAPHRAAKSTPGGRPRFSEPD